MGDLGIEPLFCFYKNRNIKYPLVQNHLLNSCVLGAMHGTVKGELELIILRNNKCWRGCGKKGTPCIVGGNVNLVQPLWKII